MRIPLLTLPALLFLAATPVWSQQKTLFRAPNIEVGSWTSEPFEWHGLMMYRTYLGMNFVKPKNPAWHGDREKDLSRLATCYQFRTGPLGIVMERFNWLPGPSNTYWADARLPVSLIGVAGNALGLGTLPQEAFAVSWSEPAVGVVSLYAGTTASYARPFQYMDFFERDARVVDFSLPKDVKKMPFFRYLQDASGRGAVIRVYEGEPRPTLEKKGAQGFYHVLVVEPFKHGDFLLHKELLTREAIELFVDKLAPDGVLCVHISHRFCDMYPILADIAKGLKLTCVLGRDAAPTDKGKRMHFLSEWVMLSKNPRILESLKPPPNYEAEYADHIRSWFNGKEPPPGYIERRIKASPFWSSPRTPGLHLWTDKGPNSHAGLYRGSQSIWEARDLLIGLEIGLRDRFNVDRRVLARYTKPVHDMLFNLDFEATDFFNAGVRARQ